MSTSVFTHSSTEVAEAIKNPCRKDCESRCAGCHVKCRDYLDFQAYRQKIYETRAKVTAINGTTPGKRAALREASKQARNGYRHRR